MKWRPPFYSANSTASAVQIDQAAERYKVNRLTVLRWIRKIEEEVKAKKKATSTDPDLLPPSSRKSTRPSTPADQVNQLRAKVRSLEEELETANFKTLYYSTLVRVAKHELGVNIEKKVRYQAIRFMLMNYPNLHIRQLEGASLRRSDWFLPTRLLPILATAS